MTSTTPPTAPPGPTREQLAAAAAAALTTVAGTLPLPGQPETRPESDPTALALDGAASAVSAALRGAGPAAGDGRLILLLAAPLADALRQTSAAEVDLVVALERPLGDIARTLTAAFGSPYEARSAQEVDAAGAVGAALAGGTTAGARLVVNGAHVGSLVLQLGAPAMVPAQPRPAMFGALDPSGAPSPAQLHRLDLLHEVEMGVTVELGRTRMTVRDLLSLTPGAVVELDRAAGSPVDLLVNGTLIARGEVVVVDEEFGVRVTEIAGPDATPGR